MGHIHLGVLPKTKPWREVADLLAGPAAHDDIFSSSAAAAEIDLSRAAQNPVFVESVRLLGMLPIAAQSGNFGQALRDLDVPSGQDPLLLDVVASVGRRLDEVARSAAEKDDFGEIARRALLSNMTSHIGDKLPGLLEQTSADVTLALRQLQNPREFSRYARGFYTRLVGEVLRYWLDRETANHVGGKRRFVDAGERSEFDRALMQYCMEATLIIREFSSGWYAKTLHRDGEITSRTATAYGTIALKKILEELKQKRGNDH